MPNIQTSDLQTTQHLNDGTVFHVCVLSTFTKAKNKNSNNAHSTKNTSHPIMPASITDLNLANLGLPNLLSSVEKRLVVGSGRSGTSYFNRQPVHLPSSHQSMCRPRTVIHNNPETTFSRQKSMTFELSHQQ
uniref:Uncharacterized protein n=1 Tax=Volvox carteri f. nagariensis TaxID=3068 RepID=Q9SBM6_VOLCA|nr:unknown [Volvox carteri f. nagariensis]